MKSRTKRRIDAKHIQPYTQIPRCIRNTRVLLTEPTHKRLNDNFAHSTYFSHTGHTTNTHSPTTTQTQPSPKPHPLPGDPRRPKPRKIPRGGEEHVRADQTLSVPVTSRPGSEFSAGRIGRQCPMTTMHRRRLPSLRKTTTTISSSPTRRRTRPLSGARARSDAVAGLLLAANVSMEDGHVMLWCGGEDDVVVRGQCESGGAKFASGF